jgi:methylmalonyl-CoA mutase N-terminal domain/subunit
VALQALSAVLGGTQSLHTNSLDEALALPTAEAATIALRTQQIIAYETGVTNTVDPLGGCYFLERLTMDMEKGAFEYFDRIDALGGMVAAIERGFPQREIGEASYRYQQALENRRKFMVGVNEFVAPEEPIQTLYIDDTVAQTQAGKLQRLRAQRSNDTVKRCLDELRHKAEGASNLMPAILDCVRAYATVGEICEALRGVFGSYEETNVT